MMHLYHDHRRHHDSRERPPTLTANIDTFSKQTTQESKCCFYEALQQLQMLLHVQWSKAAMNICPTRVKPACVAVSCKGMGALLFWSAVYDVITVHFPLFVCLFVCFFLFFFFLLSFERKVCVGKVLSMSLLFVCGSIPVENTGIEEFCRVLHEMFSGKN